MSLLRQTSSEPMQPRFPREGFSREEISGRLEDFAKTLTPDTQGSLSMHCLADSDHYMPEFRQLGDEAYDVFRRFNAIFSGFEPAAAAIEDDVLDMCVEVFDGGSEGRCNLTGGGTESIYCAMVAMREWARDTKPEITSPEVVAPYTAHAAFTRAAHYFGFQVKRVPVGPDSVAGSWRVDAAALEAAITPNTIGLVGSAPNWPYGMFDPLEALGQIALERGLWLHVDACVGGYLAPFARKAGYPIPPFELSVPGVCSLSADLHKYGYVPKPCSTVLWRSEAQQQYHYFVASDWPDGPYLAQAMLGSRPFAPTAAAWAILNSLGESGFVEVARQIMSSKNRLVEGIRKIEGLDPWENDLSLLVVSAQDLDITLVVGGMRSKGWVLLGNEEPPSIHLTVDPLTDEAIDLFLADLADVTRRVRKGESVEEGGLDYGLASGGGVPRWILDAVKLLQQRAERAR